jgi:hypothetical protein
MRRCKDAKFIGTQTFALLPISQSLINQHLQTKCKMSDSDSCNTDDTGLDDITLNIKYIDTLMPLDTMHHPLQFLLTNKKLNIYPISLQLTPAFHLSDNSSESDEFDLNISILESILTAETYEVTCSLQNMKSKHF